MSLKHTILLFSLLICSSAGFSQTADTLVKKLDSLNVEAKENGGQQNDVSSGEYNERTKITLPSYFILLGTDLKQEVTAPFHATHKTYMQVGMFALIGGGLAFADEPIQRFASKLSRTNPGVRNVSKYVTNFGGLYEAYTLGALGLYGVVFKKGKVVNTTLLATQAYLTGAAMETAVKFISGRQRPNAVDPNHPEPEPTFHGPFKSVGNDVNGGKLNSSFPSGHTTVAFAAATVFALEYKNQPIIPVVAYSAATLIGLSRLTENMHWATDVFVGALLGYVTGKQVVDNYHRYARIQEGKRKKISYLQLDMRYDFGRVAPGFVYHF